MRRNLEDHSPGFPASTINGMAMAFQNLSLQEDTDLGASAQNVSGSGSNPGPRAVSSAPQTWPQLIPVQAEWDLESSNNRGSVSDVKYVSPVIFYQSSYDITFLW